MHVLSMTLVTDPGSCQYERLFPKIALTTVSTAAKGIVLLGHAEGADIIGTAENRWSHTQC